MSNFTKMRVLICSALILMSGAIFGQTTVSGTVTDAESGDPLVGATVLEKGTLNGTITDVSGNFTIAVKSGASLVFSYVGFKTQEVAVGNQTSINVGLEIDVSSLDEVVVVGYGTQLKEDLTGAVSLVNADELKKQATNDVAQMMQGRVAGVSVRTDGQPGATPQIRIRGVSTFGIGTSAEPLYVVDGFPISGGIRDLNPNDIESIQILKDATAGAIYGNRAANGVVIIETKKGRRGEQFSVEFNTYYGFQKITDRIPLLSASEYQAINNEMMQNAIDQGIPLAELVPGNDPNSPDFINNIDTD